MVSLKQIARDKYAETPNCDQNHEITALNVFKELT